MEFEAYRRLLESLRAEVLSASPNRADPVRDGNEMADEDVQPLTEMSQAIASSRNAKNAVRLTGIEAALERLDHSPEDYGLCEDCDEPIGSVGLPGCHGLCTVLNASQPAKESEVSRGNPDRLSLKFCKPT